MAAPAFEILAYEATRLGPLCLRRRELLREPGTFVFEVTLNHEFLMSSLNTDSERALASKALALRPGKDLAVLVGGLGLGYTAKEALACERVSRVEVVEFLPQVIGWLEKGLFPLAADLKADPRFSVTRADVYKRLSMDPESLFDLVLIDVDHSPEDRLSGANAPFYTAEGAARARRHLKPGGILAVWSYDEDPRYAAVLRAAFAEVRVEPVEFFNKSVRETQTDWLLLARA